MTIEELFKEEVESRLETREWLIDMCTLVMYEATSQVLLAQELYPSTEVEDEERWPFQIREALKYVLTQNDAKYIDYVYLNQLIGLEEDTDKIQEMFELTLTLVAGSLWEDDIDDFIEMLDCSCCSRSVQLWAYQWLIEESPLPYDAVALLVQNDFDHDLIRMLNLDARGLHDGNYSYPKRQKVAA